ncbi:MAG: NAD-dependent epimerase/dehydratase family protein [Caldilineaceae bacterium]|nr:NAD-dependent epimerase/dehydratase family protein [Caldilineaceae bacterium]
MQVLITGGAGFIGAHLANALHTRGHYVRVLDDLSSGDPGELLPGINFNRGDVVDLPKLWSVLKGVDVVYHLAARVSVPASILYPREYNAVNVGGTVTLLEACRDVGVKRVILASSATVYGDHDRQPVSEEMHPRPAAPYAVSKLAAEQYLFNMGRLIGFETVALRIFNAYGPGQPLPPAHPPVIPQFFQQILGRGSVVIFGDGSQTRDFVFVDDVVEALVSAASANGVDQQIINIGSGVEVSINDLVAQIAETVGMEADLLYVTEESGGIARLVADCTKSEKLLRCRPQVTLAAGLQRTFSEDPQFARTPAMNGYPYPTTSRHGRSL